ncbi:17059_t:CDS:2, partial [Acaulospora morrowiae]
PSPRFCVGVNNMIVNINGVYTYHTHIWYHRSSLNILMGSYKDRQAPTETVPTPVYIFRGHEEQINSLQFAEDNSFLVSGDAGGIIMIWDMKTKRSVIRFKAHDDGILRATDGVTFVINVILCEGSHGRDNFIHIWKYNQLLQGSNDTREDASSLKPEKSLPVNSLNFCKFDIRYRKSGVDEEQEEILVVIPNVTESSAIDIWNLSDQRIIASSIGLDQKQERGIFIFFISNALLNLFLNHFFSFQGYCMALRLIQYPNNQGPQPINYLILAAYENGSVVLWSVTLGSDERTVVDQLWSRKEHSESALGLDVSIDKRFAISTAGDNKIVKYIFDEENYHAEPLIKSTTVKYAGIADVKIRSDGKIFATAGWDAKIRVFSSKSLKPLAILQYHRESVYALAFSLILGQDAIKQSATFENEPKDKNVDDRIVQEQRQQFTKHYLVGSGKDHRISLWEIY